MGYNYFPFDGIIVVVDDKDLALGSYAHMVLAKVVIHLTVPTGRDPDNSTSVIIVAAIFIKLSPKEATFRETPHELTDTLSDPQI